LFFLFLPILPPHPLVFSKLALNRSAAGHQDAECMLLREKSLRQLVLPLPGSPLAGGRIPISSFSLCSPFCPFLLHLWRCSWAVSSLLNSAVWFYCNSDLHLFVCVIFFFFVLFYNLDSKLAEDFVSCNLFKVLCKAVK